MKKVILTVIFSILLSSVTMAADPVSISVNVNSNGTKYQLQNAVLKADNGKILVSEDDMQNLLKVNFLHDNKKIYVNDFRHQLSITETAAVFDNKELAVEKAPYPKLISRIYFYDIEAYAKLFDASFKYNNNIINVESFGNYDYPKFLKDNNFQVLTYAQVMNRAFDENDSLQIAIRNYNILVKDADRYASGYRDPWAPKNTFGEENETAFADYTDRINTFNLRISRTNLTLTELNIESNLRNALLSIYNNYLDYKLLENNVNLQEQNYEKLKKQFELGMISKNALQEGENNLTSVKTNIEKSKTTLDKSIVNLNNMFKKSNKNIIFLFDDYICDIPDDLQKRLNSADKYENTQIDNYNIQIADLNYKYKPTYGGTDFDSLSISLDSAKNKYESDLKNNQTNIKNTYETLVNSLQEFDVATNSYNTALTNYNNSQTNYNLGTATLYDIRNAKNALLTSDVTLVKQRYSFWQNRFMLDHPNL